ncbi:ImmA/IrrE family metallo-endopeptidase [Devosia sediminis]|uniref:ImmA/IrrE family metallo-endopeptidase n=1 Tax=Devosia sediminis TaxID=2798801 RepID=UPI002E2C5AD5|nr:ImmA/IrrE family metallo-endopeptidase [Devosia sediminis]
MRPIRSEGDYAKALERAEALMAAPTPDERDELEVLQALIEKWDQRQYQWHAPTPVEAIKFRMQQQNLKPRDLESYIGSRARVSEVLSGTRSLTIDMIRALHRHLHIPAEILLGSPAELPKDRMEPSPAALRTLRSFRLMKAKEDAGAFVRRAFGDSSPIPLMRKTRTERTNAKTDLAALEAWCAAAVIKSQQLDVGPPQSGLGMDEARQLAALSCADNGPAQVGAKLAGWGIAFVALPHLPGTFLDGAAMCRADRTPVIALTIRHDRADNFWFTLLHEFCHVTHHLGKDAPIIVDDLDLKGHDAIEQEADTFAQNALVPPNIWRLANSADMTGEGIKDVARKAEVHPSIVAGRWQRTFNDYRRFSKLMVRGEVRQQLGIEAD